jgi:signal transduction histidine kinase
MAASQRVPAGRVRAGWPRRTVRLRLTLLYGGLFLLSGIALLALTYVLVAANFPLIGQSHHANPGAGPGGPGAMSGQVSAGLAAQAQVIKQRAAALRSLQFYSGIALAAMTVLSIGLGWLVAGRVLRPLRTITAAARHISASNLHERLAMAGPDDELKELGDTFDALLSRLEDAFDAQRQFVANASHELRTPLARQRTLIEVALADREPTIASLQLACERALVASAQQEQLIDALLTLARSQRGLSQRGRVDLAAITGRVLRARQAEAQHREIALRASLGPAPALGDERLAERLVSNLVSNAIGHNVPGGWVEVTTGMRGGQAVLSVANSGPLIPAAEVDRLFEPFQRLGASRTSHREGLGLGLSIVRAIATAHDAALAARPLASGGLAIEVSFPAIPATPAGPPGAAEPAGAGRLDGVPRPAGVAGPGIVAGPGAGD